MERDLADTLSEMHRTDHPDRELIRYLGCHTWQCNKKGETARIQSDDWRKLAKQRKDTPREKKLDLLFSFLAEHAGGHSKELMLPDEVALQVDEPDQVAYGSLLRDLKRDGLIDFSDLYSEFDVAPGPPIKYWVTIRGWMKHSQASKKRINEAGKWRRGTRHRPLPVGSPANGYLTHGMAKSLRLT